jgi:GNAT superfamily N-acetyltransferase
MAIERRGENGYLVSSDPAKLDLGFVHGFLANSYWARSISREVVEQSVAGSLCFGVYDAGGQVGFGRVITDRATFAYIADVFIVDSRRGRGLAKLLLETILSHPDLKGLRRIQLVTRDAHGLYEKFGFRALENPGRHLEIVRPRVYEKDPA